MGFEAHSIPSRPKGLPDYRKRAWFPGGSGLGGTHEDGSGV